MTKDARDTAVQVRLATADDAGTLGIIGPAAYATAYADIWDDAAAFVDKLDSFSAACFAECLASPASRIWIAEQRGKAVGYLTLVLDSPSPITHRARGAEITRFYLLGPASGQGIGKTLFDAACTEARAHGAAYLWLDLMAHADWAREAYERLGLRVTGSTQMTQPVKADKRDKLVMERELA